MNISQGKNKMKIKIIVASSVLLILAACSAQFSFHSSNKETKAEYTITCWPHGNAITFSPAEIREVYSLGGGATVVVFKSDNRLTFSPAVECQTRKVYIVVDKKPESE